MRIVFIGCVKFSNYMLRKLASINANVVGVVTKKNSYFNSDFCDLTEIIKEIPYFYAKDINSDDCIKFVNDLKPDYIFCCGWSNLIKKQILDICPVIGYHPAALPKNKGRHPIIWALALGLSETASTFFLMDENVDNGDIISQIKIDISHEDDAATLYKKMITTAEKQIEEIYNSLKTKSIVTIPQNNTNANTWRKRSVSDGKIDFRMSSDAVYNLVRALAKPYVGAHVEYRGRNIKIWKVKKTKCDFKNIESGKIIALNGKKITVKTYDAAIEILEHDFDILPYLGEYL